MRLYLLLILIILASNAISQSDSIKIGVFPSEHSNGDSINKSLTIKEKDQKVIHYFNDLKGVQIKKVSSELAEKCIYFENGAVHSCSEGYLELKMDSIYFYSEGHLDVRIETYTKFIKNGVHKEWNQSGKLIQKGIYLQDEKVGIWLKYDIASDRMNESVYPIK